MNINPDLSDLTKIADVALRSAEDAMGERVEGPAALLLLDEDLSAVAAEMVSSGWPRARVLSAIEDAFAMNES